MSGVDRVTSWRITEKGIHVGIVVLRDISKSPLADRATITLEIEEAEKGFLFYLKGTYIDDLEAPIPGDPCLTGLLVTENSPK